MIETPPFQLIINQIDELIFDETGEHLDDLQYAILEEVLKEKSYKEIAKKKRRSEKYIQGVASKLWKTISEVLGKKVNKKNLKSSLQRYYYTNFSEVVNALNNVKINKGNICFNNPEKEELTEEKKHIEVHLDAIADLIKEGLTAEQIAIVFKLPLEFVQQQIDKV